jgi:uncharacterized membrane protein
MIAALYAAVTVALAPVSYGPLQLRVAEALTLLPFYIPEAVPGLFVGCLIANFFSPNGALDMAAGSLATLTAAWLSRRMPRLWLAALPPVVINMFVIGTMLHFIESLPLWLTVFKVGVGQAAACALGVPLMKTLEKLKLVKR